MAALKADWSEILTVDVEQLKAIHEDVAGRFTYVSDAVQFGKLEYWVEPDGERMQGDCEDFALACRARCRDLGIPSRLVYCLANGQGHCVLEVQGYIFDCNQPYLSTRDFLGYEWISISGYEPGQPWRAITNG